MTKDLVKHVKEDADKHNIAAWPKLEVASDAKTLDQIWTEAGSEAALVALVVDADPYGDGFAAIINYHQNPQVHVVVLPESHPLAKQFGGVAIPSVHVFKRSQPNSPSFSSSELSHFAQISDDIDKVLEESGGQVNVSRGLYCSS